METFKADARMCKIIIFSSLLLLLLVYDRNILILIFDIQQINQKFYVSWWKPSKPIPNFGIEALSSTKSIVICFHFHSGSGRCCYSPLGVDVRLLFVNKFGIEALLPTKFIVMCSHYHSWIKRGCNNPPGH